MTATATYLEGVRMRVPERVALLSYPTSFDASTRKGESSIASSSPAGTGVGFWCASSTAAVRGFDGLPGAGDGVSACANEATCANERSRLVAATSRMWPKKGYRGALMYVRLVTTEMGSGR